MPPTLAQLKRRNILHRANADYWVLLDALLQGGSKLTPDLKKQLLANPDGRPAKVVAERVKVARYFNKIGPIAARFLSQLFAAPIQFEGSKDKFWLDSFFSEGALLPATDDDGKSSFASFLRSATLQGLGQGKAIAQIDTAIATETLTKAEQRQRREDEPYVLLVPRGDLWDWESDRQGFKFAKLHRFVWQRDSWNSDPIAIHDFTIYQRQPDGTIVASRYTVSQSDKSIGQQFDAGLAEIPIDRISEEKAQIETVNGLEERPIFNLKGQYRFPIVTMTMPPALWLADQLHDPQVSHFNQTASLEYGLVTSNYAMPTIATQDIEDFTRRNQRWGEGYYLALDPSQQESVGWTERGGGTFSTSMEYRDKVDEDIDRTVQQIALAASDAVTSTSGEAIRQARRPETILLQIYGAMVREFAKGILDVAAIAHGESVNWTVNGLDDFDEADLQEEAQETGAIVQVQVPSPTFGKEVQKSFAREVAKQKEFDPVVLKTILDEIDKAPTPAPPDTGQGADAGGDAQDTGDGGSGGDTGGDSTDALLSELGLN